MSKTLKNISIAVVAILLVFVGYKYLSNSKESTSGTSTLGTNVAKNTSDLQIGSEFRDVLSKISRISLDDKIFNDRAFDNLRDFSLALAPAEIGLRQNPFAPIGVNNVRALNGNVDTSVR